MNISSIINDVKIFFRGFPLLLTGAIVMSMSMLFLALNNPSQTLCDSKVKNFFKTQSYFTVGKNKPMDKDIMTKIMEFFTGVKTESYSPLMVKQFTACQERNSPGSCFNYFENMESFLSELRNVGSECGPIVEEKYSFIKKLIEKSLKLYLYLPWQGGGEILGQKMSWFESHDIRNFCNLQKHHARLFGESYAKSYLKKIVDQLPNPKEYNEHDKWSRSLASVHCQTYL